MFFRIIQHLLPHAKAWDITIDKQLRQFFQGLADALGDATKLFFDLLFLDLDPVYTRQIGYWETQFGLAPTIIDEDERRDRLVATWKALIGGQSPRYIQDTLQNAGFDVYIHEWWVLPVVGSPVARNPNLYLASRSLTTQYITNCGAQKANCGHSTAVCGAKVSSGALVQYVANCGTQKANCGHSEAICGASNQPTGFPLVNKLLVPSTLILTAGSIIANCGHSSAICGGTNNAYVEKEYQVTSDSTKWGYFLYIGGENFPDQANVQQSRKNEFETLCLKICPTQQWLGILINYS